MTDIMPRSEPIEHTITNPMHPRGETPIADNITDETADRLAAAIHAGWAILGAYQRGLTPPGPGYLADTLAMVLNAVGETARRPQLLP